MPPVVLAACPACASADSWHLQARWRAPSWRGGRTRWSPSCFRSGWCGPGARRWAGAWPAPCLAPQHCWLAALLLEAAQASIHWLLSLVNTAPCLQAREHILNLVGRTAPPDLLQRMTFLTFHHDPRILFIDTVRCGGAGCLHWGVCIWQGQGGRRMMAAARAAALELNDTRPSPSVADSHALMRSAFTLGNAYIAEVDIVLQETMVLREAHDIGGWRCSAVQALVGSTCAVQRGPWVPCRAPHLRRAGAASGAAGSQRPRLCAAPRVPPLLSPAHPLPTPNSLALPPLPPPVACRRVAADQAGNAARGQPRLCASRLGVFPQARALSASSASQCNSPSYSHHPLSAQTAKALPPPCIQHSVDPDACCGRPSHSAIMRRHSATAQVAPLLVQPPRSGLLGALAGRRRRHAPAARVRTPGSSLSCVVSGRHRCTACPANSLLLGFGLHALARGCNA